MDRWTASAFTERRLYGLPYVAAVPPRARSGGRAEGTGVSSRAQAVRLATKTLAGVSVSRFVNYFLYFCFEIEGVGTRPLLESLELPTGSGRALH